MLSTELTHNVPSLQKHSSQPITSHDTKETNPNATKPDMHQNANRYHYTK